MPDDLHELRGRKVYIWEFLNYAAFVPPLKVSFTVAMHRIWVPISWSFVSNAVHGIVLRSAYEVIIHADEALKAAQDRSLPGFTVDELFYQENRGEMLADTWYNREPG